jgi:SAM-dependent methyltransferase
VGPNGHVIGVDLVEPMLDRARAKAEAEHLDNVDLRVGDMRELDFPDASFDAVVSVFGVFFVPDMVALVADLWRLVAPGGSLAVTVWGPDVFEPLRTAFADAVERERPDLPSAGWPLVGADALRTLLLEAGIDESAIEVETLAATHPLLTPDDWWAIVQGTVLHLTVDQLDAEQRDRVRAACDGYATEHNVTEITATVVFGVARKPAL